MYRARDTKLNRDVALKILPDAFASDLDRLARFTREAQTLASLNHSNIAHLHGLEESNGVLIRRSPPRRWLGHSLHSPLDLRSKNELEHTPRADKLCGIKREPPRAFRKPADAAPGADSA